MVKKILWLSALMVATMSSAYAQKPATPAPTPAPAPAQSTTVSIPTSKIALIYSDLFADPKTGIAKLNSLVTKLNSEFQKQRDDLNALGARAQALEDEIKRLQQATGAPIDQKSLEAKIDQLEQMKKDYQRKGEDAQASYNRRKQELLTPVQEEIGKAIEAFAKARGIHVVIDGTQMPLLYAADSIDITRAFITEFNSKNPVTASTTPPE